MNDASAIHDIGYRRYEGSRIGAAGAWRALVWQGFRTMFGLGRPAKSKVVPVLVLVVTMLPALASVSANAVSQGAIKLQYGQLIRGELLMFVLFVAAQAPELLSRDQQHRVLPLILTRDVSRASYATARLASIFAALFLVTLAPLLLLYIGEIGSSIDPAATFARMGGRIGPIFAQASLTTVCIGGVAAALAAWTPRRSYATAAIIGTFLVLAAVAGSLDDTARISSHAADFIDPVRSLHTQSMLLFGEKTRRMEVKPPHPLGVYVAMMVVRGVLGALVLGLRMRLVRA